MADAPYAHASGDHLYSRSRKGIADKVNTAEFDPAAYSDALARAALDKERRFHQAASAPAPFASTSEGQEARFPAEQHRAHKHGEVADKVNSGGVAVDAQTYYDNAAAILRGKEERFHKAATASAPYAVLRSRSAELADVFPANYEPLRGRKREVVEKPGTREFDMEVYASALTAAAGGKQDRFARAATAEAPFAVGQGADVNSAWYRPDHHLKPSKKMDVVGKVNVEAYDAAAVTAAARANTQGAASTAIRNWGVPGLLRQDGQ